MTKKKLIWQLPFLLLLVVGTVWVIRQNANRPYISNEGRVFGTFYHMTYQADRDMQELIEQELKRVDAEFSMFNDSSTVARINRGEEVALSEEFLDVFRLAERVNRETGGAFDVTVAPLVNEWGFGFKESRLPSDEVIASLLAYVGQNLVALETRDGATFLRKKDSRVMLDFSAIAKGYGCDAVARVLRQNGVENYLVEIGGEIVSRGVNAEGREWSVGVTKPVEMADGISNEIDTVLSVGKCAMATSGNYRNFYVKDGKKYAHTIDPITGHPVSHTLLSATVIAPTCAEADAWATAFMVMGAKRAEEILARHHELKAFLIKSD